MYIYADDGIALSTSCAFKQIQVTIYLFFVLEFLINYSLVKTALYLLIFNCSDVFTNKQIMLQIQVVFFYNSTNLKCHHFGCHSKIERCFYSKQSRVFVS